MTVHAASTSLTPTLSEPELRLYAEGLEAIRARSETVLAGLDDARFNWRPAPGAWSLAQCFGHLTVSGNLYLDGMEKAIATAREGGTLGRGPFKHGFLGNLFVRSMEPPARLKVKNPKAFTPPPAQALEEGKGAFFALQDRIEEALYKADGLHLARVRVASPISPLITLSLGQCFGLLTAHERRHLEQAERIRRDTAFPGE